MRPCAIANIIVGCVAFSVLTTCQAQAAHWETIEVDNQTIDLWVPDCVGRSSPVILSLHGWGQTKDLQKGVDHFVNYSNPDCAVIAYPTGQERGEFSSGYSWNAGGCCPNANRYKRNDVEYLNEVVVAAANKTGADENAAFVIGISNGAQMAIRFACQSKKVKALVAISGLLVNGTDEHHTESFECERTVPMLHFHGDADSIVPYYGCNRTSLLAACWYMAMEPGWNPLPWPSVPESIASWRDRNQISDQEEAALSFRNGSTYCQTWGASLNNVTLCTIHGEGHAWPGQCSWSGKVPGMRCSWDIDASAESLAFFHNVHMARRSGQIIV